LDLAHQHGVAHGPEQEANRRTAEARSRGYPNAYTRFVR
jgi:hypothetical protein